MPKFNITVESPGLLSNASMLDAELSDEALKALNSRLENEKGFPEGVLAVLSAYIASDGDEDEDEVRVFVSVSLRVEADSKEAAECLDLPEKFLNEIADLLGSTDVAPCALELEERAWEVSDSETAMDLKELRKLALAARENLADESSAWSDADMAYLQMLSPSNVLEMLDLFGVVKQKLNEACDLIEKVDNENQALKAEIETLKRKPKLTKWKTPQ